MNEDKQCPECHEPIKLLLLCFVAIMLSGCITTQDWRHEWNLKERDHCTQLGGEINVDDAGYVRCEGIVREVEDLEDI